MIDIQRYQNVAVGDTVADTQKAYEALLATNGVVAEGEGGATDVVTVKGTIRSMNQAVIEGNTHFYLTVEGEDGSIFDFALPGLLDIVGYKVGDEINFTYVEAAGSNVSPAYEILGEGGNAPATEDAAGSGAAGWRRERLRPSRGRRGAAGRRRPDACRRRLWRGYRESGLGALRGQRNSQGLKRAGAISLAFCFPRST